MPAGKVWLAGNRPYPVAGVTTPVSINAATTLTVPTAAQQILYPDELQCIVQVEGASTSRWTTNGVTPTAAVGMLVQPNALITLTGFEDIVAFQIIGTAAGNSIEYQFQTANVR
jgi:hypothetical protein